MENADEVKARLDLVDLIAEYLPLKPAGTGAFKGLCPFHQEKTPSFHVSRTRQAWHCFGCHEGGDHFTFVQKMEGMEFREALQLLAEKVGLTLPQFDRQQVTKKQRLLEIVDLAARFFRSALRVLPQAEEARQYLKRRGLDDLTTDLFGLGYAPASWSTLTEALYKKGVNAEELLEAGLVIRRERGEGVYDRFRDRIMFPITDVQGRAIGFTGRILRADQKEAKYVNTPETYLYHKSSVLYGLDKAKGEIRRENLAVIVEGNMDVIASHQHNVNYVVAASGTALTLEQLGLLKRFTTNLAIAFDQDAAGNAATLRGLDLARAQDFSLRIITLPPEGGKDPDEAIRKDPEIWKQAIRDALSIMEWVYRRAFRGRHSEQPEHKKEIAQEVLPEIKRIADPVERDHWLRRLAGDLGVGEAALREAGGKMADQPAGAKTIMLEKSGPIEAEKPVALEARLEQHLLALLISHPDVWRAMETDPLPLTDFEDASLSALYVLLQAEYNQTNSFSVTYGADSMTCIRLPAYATPEQATLFRVTALLAEHTFAEQPITARIKEFQRLRELWKRQRQAQKRQRLEQEMREAERVGDAERIAELVQRFSSLQE